MTFVPTPARESGGSYRVKRGDTLVSICNALGQPLANYPDLIAANLDRPMTSEGVPEGQAVVFAALHEGDTLNVPAPWAAAPVTAWPFTGKLAGIEGEGGALGDGVTDAFVAAFPFNPQSSISKDQYDANVHVLTSWWRDKYPNGAQPSGAGSWTPFQTAAGAWWNNVASKLYKALPFPQNTQSVSDAIRAINFGMVPLPQLLQLYKAGLPILSGLDRDKLNLTLESYVKPGQFPKAKKPVDWTLLSDKSFNFYNSLGFGPQQWLGAGGIRWDLFPIDQIVERVVSGKSKPLKSGQSMNDWVFQELKTIITPEQDITIEIPNPGNLPGGQNLPNIPGPDGLPGGQNLPVPPTGGCPPQGVPKNGTCDCTEKMGPTAIFDEKLFLCVDCGPNTKPYVKGTKECECIDGYEPHPSKAEGSGCVKKADPGKTLDKPAPEPSSPWKTAALVGGALLAGVVIAKALNK